MRATSPCLLLALTLGACTTSVLDTSDDVNHETDAQADRGDTDAPATPDTDADHTDGADHTDSPGDTDVPHTDTPDSDPPAALCAGQVVGTAVGECAPDFTLLDKDGVAHTLYDHAGDVIVLDFSTMWCPHCRNLADDLEAVHTTYGSQGVTVITVLHENNQSQDPSPADLQAWIDAFSVTHAVLADPGGLTEAVFGGFYQPNALILDRDLTVVWRMTGSAAASGLDAAVMDAL